MLEHGTIVRAFAPSGTYWSNNFITPTAIYVNEGDLIFTACHFDCRQHAGEYYTEFDVPMLEELMLLAALVLPIGWNCGIIFPYPLHAATTLRDVTDLSEPGKAQQLGSILRNHLASNETMGSRDGPPPPGFGGSAYRYRDSQSPLALQQRIFDAINVSDYLLMRGLRALIKGGMLVQHRWFGDDAHHSLYIALDASFQLILRKLRKAGMANPGAVDAQALMEDAFDGQRSGRKYFEDYYEDRIMAMHPWSQFGVSPYPPLMHSHFYGLYYDLREIYRWLVLGERIDLTADHV